jgi:hypothetical protein
METLGWARLTKAQLLHRPPHIAKLPNGAEIALCCDLSSKTKKTKKIMKKV